MTGMGGMLRANAWLAIIVALVATAGLFFVDQPQLASLLGCIAGILLMWKSEIDNPSTPPDLEEA